MASIQGLRHLERPADNRGRHKHVPGRKPFFVAVAAFIALAAAALIATLGQGGTTSTAVPQFVKTELGARTPAAKLSRSTAPGTTAKIVASGYEVASKAGTVRVTQAGATPASWVRFANGTTRSTSYGNEAIVLGGARADGEQYLTVREHSGAHTLKWKLATGSLRPTLRSDGSVLISPDHVVSGFRILPLAILDTDGKNVTPDGAAWGIQHRAGSWWLTLALDDSSLPTPYVIDPALESFRAAQSANTGFNATTMTITKPVGLAVNDLMIAAITARGGTNTFVCAPAVTGAWTSIRADDSTTVLHQQIYWKVATAADVAAASYIFTFGTAAGCATTTSLQAAGGISAFFGVNDAAPIDANSGQANASGTAVTAPTMTNATAGNFLVGAFGSANGAAPFWTAPGGLPTFTERWDAASTIGVAANRATSELATATTTAAGLTGTKVATGTTAAVNIGQLLTLSLDTVAPTDTIAVTSAAPAGSTFLSGTNVFYNGTAAGSFQLQDTVAETGSGVASVAFPVLGGTTTGWTHTTQTLTTPVGGPYVTTNNFAWGAATSSAPTEAVTDTDNATNANATTLTFVNDTTGPTAFALTAPSAGATIANGQTVSASPTDAGSGVAQVDFRYCTGWTCSWASGTSIGTDASSPFSVTWNNQPTNGTYTVVARATDNVGNTTDSSPTTVTVNNAPAAPSVDMSTQAVIGAASGTTLTWSQTVGSQSNRILLVSASQENSVTCSTTGVTYGGTAMVKIGDITTTGVVGPNRDCVSLWYMLNPPTGTANVIATTTPSTTTALSGGGVVIYNVKEAAPDASITSLNESGIASATLSTIAANSLVVDTYSSGNTLGNLAPVAPQAQAWVVDGNATESTGMSSKTVAAPGSTTMSWIHSTPGAENRSVIVAAAYSPETTAPTSALSFTEATNPGGQFELSTGAHAWTYFYNPAASGTFTMTDAASDASGITAVEFPDISTVTGFTGTGVRDTAAAYTSNTYTFGNTNTTAPTAKTVNVFDTFGNLTPETVSFVKDSINPTGGAISVPAFSSTLNNITLTTTPFTDADSGIATNVITRSNAQAPVSPGVCPAVGTFTGSTVVTTPDTVPTAGQCYVYTLTGTDNVGNPATVTTTNAILVDTTAPAFTSGASNILGTQLTWTIAETGSGLDMASTTPGSAFTVLVNGVADPVTAVSTPDLAHVVLTLTTRVYGNDTVTVAYTSAALTAAQKVKDQAGNPLANLAAQATTLTATGALAQSTVVAATSPIVANGVTTSAITVQLKNSAGTNLAASGGTVTLTTTGGSLGAVTNNANGTYSATLTSSTIAGPVTVTAKLDGTNITGTAIVSFVAGPVTAAQSTVAAVPASVVADGATTSTVTVTLKDANSNPVAGKTVTLAKGSGSSTITTVSGVTNAAGQATFTVKDTVAEATTYTATDATDAITVTQTAVVTFTPGPVTAAQSTVVAAPTSVTANGVTNSTVTVTLKDANSNPVAGKTVTLAKGSGSSTITTVLGVTNAAGQATFTVNDAAVEATVYTATDTTDALTVTQTATVTFVVGPVTAAQSTVSTAPASVTANGVAASTVTVTLKDAQSHPVSGKTVTLAKGSGSSTITTVLGVTNAAGQATFTVTDTVAEATTYTATDTTDAVVVTQTGLVTFTAGPVTAAQSTVSAAPASVTANGVATSTVTVTLKDANSNPVSGKTVTLAKGGGSSTITTVSGTTNASGVATFTVSDTVAEATTYTATDTTDAVTVTQTAAVTFTVGPVTAAQSTVSASPASIVADGATTSTVTVTLRDATSNPVSGKTVTLAKGSGSSTITTVLGVTNAAGQATFTVKDTAAEATTYTATDTTDAVTVTQTAVVTFTAGAVSATVSTISAAPASVLADGVTTSTVTVTAKDAFGNTIAGQTVSLAQGAGASTISPASATTNGSGVATFTVKDTTAQSVSYTATIGITGVLGSAGVTFTPGAATHLSVAAPASTTAGALFTTTVTALDANNNTAPSYVGTVHFTSSDPGSPTLPANYTFVAGDNGVHTFTNAVALKTVASQTVVATDTVTGSITGTKTVTVTPATAATLTVTTTAGSPQTAGVAFSTTVTAKDAFGNVATGYTGIAHFTSTDGAATLPANYTFVAGDSGSHTFAGVALATVGVRTVTATDTLTGTITGTANVTVAPATAATFVVTTTAGSPQTAGVAFSSTVTAKDAFGNVATGYTGGVHFTSSDAQSTTGAGLPADYTFVAGDNGTHTFTNGMTLKTVGSRTITATDTVLGTITGTSPAVTVAASGASTFVVTTTAGSPQTAGGTFSATVTAKDAFGNVATGYTGIAHFTSTDGAATLPANYTFVAGDSGSHTFAGVALKTVGSQSVLATDTVTGSITGTSASVSVAPAPAATLTVTGPANATAGVSFPTLTVTAKDAFGNTATGYLGTVTFSGGGTSPTLPGNYTFVAGDNGTHTFTATLTQSGARTITATDTVTGTITGTTGTITVGSAAATTLTVAGPANATAGVPFATLSVTAKDTFGNVATGYLGTVTFSGGGTGPTLPGNYTFVAGDNGTHTFTATLTQSGARTITAADTVTGTINGTTGAIAVGSAAATTYTVAGPANATAGVSFSTLTVTAKDGFGNTATGYTGTVTFSGGGTCPALPANYTFVAGDNGTHTFTATLKQSGARTITATDTVTGTINGTTGTITVAPASAATLTVTGPANATAGVSFNTLTVTAKDAFGNTATGYTGTVAFSGGGTGTTLPGNYAFVAGDNGTHTFTATLTQSGARTITATDTVTGTITGTTGTITVGSAAATTLTVAGPANATAGVSFGTLTVTAKDAFGNVATGYLGTVTFSGGGTSPTLPANYSFVAGDNGTHTYSATLTQAGARTITATDTVTGSINGTTGAIAVAPAGAATFTVAGPANATAGVSFNTLTVTAKDAFGNVATGYTGIAHFTGGGTSPTLPANYTFVAGDNGTHTFSATLTQAGGQTVTVTDTVTGTINGTTGTITVAPVAAATLTVSGPANATAGVSFGSLTVTAKDASATSPPATSAPSPSAAAARAPRSRPTTPSSQATTAPTPSPRR